MQIKTIVLDPAAIIPPDLKRLLIEYYRAMAPSPGEAYAAKRWSVLEQSSSYVCYRVVADAHPVGWVIVNRETSTIEELLPAGAYSTEQATAQLIDRVLERHKLVAALVPRSDAAQYESLKKCGFRPTRALTRDGVPMTRMDLSAAVYLQRLPQLHIEPWKGREVVAVEKVAPAQTAGDIRQSLVNLIDKLGGLQRYVQPGQSVVIKPNLVSEHGLKDGVKKGGVVTDSRLIEALVELLSPLAGGITIAEGSSINRSETMKMFKHYGLDTIADRCPDKVRLVDLNADRCVDTAVPGGRRSAKRKIPVTLAEAGVIINMPVLKLHFAAGASLSIKNLQGAIPPLEKYKVHFFGLWQNLINTYNVIKPHLIIMDGLYGQEDFGPVSGSPRKMDVLIAGTNPVAVDTVALRIMGLTPCDSPPVIMACHEGMGPADWDHIEVRGPSLDELSCSFKRPLIDLRDGERFKIMDGGACPGCRGYLHFVLNKLRRPDPLNEKRQLIDRPLGKTVNVFIGPGLEQSINPDNHNVFMGICQQHHSDNGGTFLPGCPPHAEEIINGVFQFYRDVERPKYADQTEEAKLGEMLRAVLREQEETEP